MRPEDATDAMHVRNRRLLCFGYVTKVEGKRVIYVLDDSFQEANAEDLDPVAIVVPVLVMVYCPVCGDRTSRKPFDGWVVEICEECGEKYAAGPYQVGPPLDPPTAEAIAEASLEAEPC